MRKKIVVCFFILILFTTVCSKKNIEATGQLSSIEISLLENGKTISCSDNNVIEKPMFKEIVDKPLKMEYDVNYSVKNTGSIDIYTRAIIYKKWLDKDGKTSHSLNPSYIEVMINKNNGWFIDKQKSTSERTVLYYNKILPVNEETTFIAGIKINNSILNYVKQNVTKDSNGNRTIEMEYIHEGTKFALDIEIDAVQTHNAQDAIKEKWGVDVIIADDGTLSLR